MGNGEATVATGDQLRLIADIVVDAATAIQGNERVLVLTDSQGDPALTGVIAERARRASAEVVVLEFDKVDSIRDIPSRVAAAIAASDVVIPLCKSRILYSEAMKAGRENRRVLYMADIPTELLLRPVVQECDFDELARVADVFSRLITGSHRLRVETAAGTSAKMQMIDGRRISISKCRSRVKGDHDYLPGGAWFGCPDEDSVDGTFVVDCSIEPGVAGGLLHEPIALTYRAGRLVGIEGGSQADEFKEWIDRGDDELRGVAHNGGGINKSASPYGNLMEDERIRGAFNIAGGNNTLGWPGRNHSAFHFDGMMLNASYWVDDVPLCESGQFVHPELIAAQTRK